MRNPRILTCSSARPTNTNWPSAVQRTRSPVRYIRSRRRRTGTPRTAAVSPADPRSRVPHLRRRCTARRPPRAGPVAAGRRARRPGCWPRPADHGCSPVGDPAGQRVDRGLGGPVGVDAAVRRGGQLAPQLLADRLAAEHQRARPVRAVGSRPGGSNGSATTGSGRAGRSAARDVVDKRCGSTGSRRRRRAARGRPRASSSPPATRRRRTTRLSATRSRSPPDTSPSRPAVRQQVDEAALLDGTPLGTPVEPDV